MEKILFLKSVPIFNGLKMNELANIAGIAQEVLLKRGEILFNENEIGDCLYIIVSGKVRVYKMVNQKEKTLAILGEKESVGEMSIFDDELRSATVQLAEDSLLMKITSEDFRDLVYEYPEIAFGLFKVLSIRIREKQTEEDTAASPIVYNL